MDTIFAQASAAGRSGVSVYRISGPSALETFRLFDVKPGAPRRMTLRSLKHGGQVVDEALTVWFPEGESFTGEPVVELHLHGSLAVSAIVTRVLGSTPGYRSAEPGEFTRRALEADRLDLVKVEALADLLEAETEVQHRQAMQGFSGLAQSQISTWRNRLLRCVALVEALIDFSDEELPGGLQAQVSQELEALGREFQDAIDGSLGAERVRAGFEVALVGEPNSGKSTLLNMLAGRDAAIVSDIPGTTRDVLEARMDVQGLAVTVLDLAGLREASDPIERLGVKRAMERASAADLRIFFGEADLGVDRKGGDIQISPKADVVQPGEGLAVSGVTGEGIDTLLAEIARELHARVPKSGLATRERHRAAIEEAALHTETCLEILRDGDARAEVAAEELRAVVRALDVLVGRIGTEDVLGQIFESFCIGK